jgi:hypothetical protein
MAVVPGFQWDYDAWITLGASHEIRERFEKISREKQASGDRD